MVYKQSKPPDALPLSFISVFEQVVSHLILGSEVLNATFHPHYLNNRMAFALVVDGFKLLNIDNTAESEPFVKCQVDNVSSTVSTASRKGQLMQIDCRCFCWLAGEMLAIVDKQNAIHVYQGGTCKDKIPCDDFVENERVTGIIEYKKGLLVSGDRGCMIFFYPVDSW